MRMLRVTGSLALVFGILVIACAGKQNASPQQAEVSSAEVPTGTEPPAQEPAPSAAPSASTAPAPSATPPAASATVPTQAAPTLATGQGGGAAAAPTSKSAPAASTKPAPSTTTKQPSATGSTPPDAPAKPTAAAKYAGDSPCTATSFKFGAVRSACERGGRPEVKGVMKNVTNKAKAAGTELKCTSCHTSTKTYELKDNAVEDLRKWL